MGIDRDGLRGLFWLFLVWMCSAALGGMLGITIGKTLF